MMRRVSEAFLAVALTANKRSTSGAKGTLEKMQIHLNNVFLSVIAIIPASSVRQILANCTRVFKICKDQTRFQNSRLCVCINMYQKTWCFFAHYNYWFLTFSLSRASKKKNCYIPLRIFLIIVSPSLSGTKFFGASIKLLPCVVVFASWFTSASFPTATGMTLMSLSCKPFAASVIEGNGTSDILSIITTRTLLAAGRAPVSLNNLSDSVKAFSRSGSKNENT